MCFRTFPGTYCEKPSGYRKPLSGPGSWAVRVGVADGKGWEKTLWGADDNGLQPDGERS